MRPIDAALLHRLVQGGRPEIVEAAAPVIEAHRAAAGVITPLRAAHFLAQVAFESEEFTRLEEDLDYSSAVAITCEWPELAPRAAALVHNPEALANAAYGLVGGNRGESTGDGWLYRGRGLIQLTGRYNYMLYGDRIGEDMLGRPALAADPAIAARAALEYWRLRDCNVSADRDDCEGVTRRVVGSARAVPERARLKRRALALLTADQDREAVSVPAPSTASRSPSPAFGGGGK